MKNDTKEMMEMIGTTGEGNGNLLQYSCLENPVDRGAWWAMVHGVAKSWTQLKRLSTHARGLGRSPPSWAARSSGFYHPSRELPWGCTHTPCPMLWDAALGAASAVSVGSVC